MNTTTEATILNGDLPIFKKMANKNCYVFHPGGYKPDDVCFSLDKFMIPYFRVKKEEVAMWLQKQILMPPNPLFKYEGIILTYSDQDGGEPSHGAAFFVV